MGQFRGKATLYKTAPSNPVVPYPLYPYLATLVRMHWQGWDRLLGWNFPGYFGPIPAEGGGEGGGATGSGLLHSHTQV
jgi:hypothetical protein